MTTILIAEDHTLIRDAWKMILNQDPRLKVIGTCSDAETAVNMSVLMQPDILLMDINLKPFSGIEATRQILKINLSIRVIAVTMHNHPEFLQKILEVGARGYVTKNSSSTELTNAILEVAAGNVFICEEMKNLLADQSSGFNRLSAMEELTAREKEIIQFIKVGRSSREISEELHISTHTVDAHRHNLMKKLKVKNVASLIEVIHTRDLNK